jgi:hypothetical protein
MYRNTPKNILIWNMKLKMNDIIQKSKRLKNMIMNKYSSF